MLRAQMAQARGKERGSKGYHHPQTYYYHQFLFLFSSLWSILLFSFVHLLPVSSALAALFVTFAVFPDVLPVACSSLLCCRVRINQPINMSAVLMQHYIYYSTRF
ncbi:hypothetical protein V8F33_004039 [Rhypophila sp. PSN 637]